MNVQPHSIRPWLGAAAALQLAVPQLAQAQPPQASAARGVDLNLVGAHITQSIQREDPSIALIGGRSTTLRLLTEVTGASTPVPVDAYLEVYYADQLYLVAYPDNGPLLSLGASTLAEEDGTLNFTFIPPLVPEDIVLTFVLTLDPDGLVDESDEGNNELSITLPFSYTRPPSLMALPVDYHASSAAAGEVGLPDQTLTRPGIGDAFVWGIYPFPSYDPQLEQRYQLLPDSQALYWDQDINASGSSSALLAEIERRRLTQDPVPDYLYAWLRGNPYSNNGRSNGIPATAAFGNTDPTRHQRTYAHELGHNFGLSHTSNPIQVYGWDSPPWLPESHADVHLRPPTLNDIMVPGQLSHTAWIQPTTYLQIMHDFYRRLRYCDYIPWDAFGDCDDREVHRRELLRLSLTRGDGGRWALDSVAALSARMAPLRPSAEGRVEITALDAHGEVIYTTHVSDLSPVDAAEAGGETLDHLVVALPRSPGVRRIEIREDGALHASWRPSPSAPEVEIQGVRGAAHLGRGDAVRWSARDADGDALTTLFQISVDGGASFSPLQESAAPSGALDVDWDALPLTREGVLRVTVTDGWSARTRTFEGLRFGQDHPATGRILSPRDGQALRPGGNLPLLAVAADEDRPREHLGDLVWRSSQDGLLGEGEALNVSDLSPGEHTLSLVQERAEGSLILDQVRVTVY